jgi:hypothetical protein
MESPTNTDITVDTVFELLANRYRRQLLFDLLEHTPQEAIPHPDDTPTDSDECDRVQIEVYHLHLPKLADAGLIDWDHRSGTVVRGHNFAAFKAVLEANQAVLKSSTETR